MTKRSSRLKLIIMLALLVPICAFSDVRLPRLISDGMVLQRQTRVNIWGWASDYEQISLHFVDSTYHTIADENGDWSIVLTGLEAGGPYDMQIKAGNNITIHDVLIGDVWVCSGQSNMELPMRRVSWVYGQEIEHSENPFIRYFEVPDKYDFKEPQNDFESGDWLKANPENLMNFSAVSYFYAKALYEQYKIPIGLINSALGGSPAEAWISEDALKEFPEYYKEAQRFKDPELIEQIRHSDDQRIRAWYDKLNRKDEGLSNPRMTWYSEGLSAAEWTTMDVPGYWADTDSGLANGSVWFRKKIEVPPSSSGKKGKLILGRIVDADSVFVNGVFVGTTSYQYPPRRYDIPRGLLKAGENTIAVRVISELDKGGFVPDKPYKLTISGDTLDLAGPWRYRPGAKMEPLESRTFIRWKPLGLYNAMIAPLLNYRIKGVIWYQGEANAAKPVEYQRLFPALIQDWRKQWMQGDFPFLFVQLPNFMEPQNHPSESNWALLREAQLKTLAVPHTAMVVTIDTGEWNDIHPLDKKDVGDRLALAARKVAYGEQNVVYSGPIYKSMKIEGSKIRISFTCLGSGLMAKSAQPGGFAIAGPDKRFVWAKARIENSEVVVWSEDVANPVAVRYAWADNPDRATLYNREGLPASPFRTDNW